MIRAGICSRAAVLPLATSVGMLSEEFMKFLVPDTYLVFSDRFFSACLISSSPLFVVPYLWLYQAPLILVPLLINHDCVLPHVLSHTFPWIPSFFLSYPSSHYCATSPTMARVLLFFVVWSIPTEPCQ